MLESGSKVLFCDAVRVWSVRRIEKKETRLRKKRGRRHNVDTLCIARLWDRFGVRGLV